MTVILADGTTDQSTDHAPANNDGEHSYWITTAGHLTVYLRNPSTGHDDQSETVEAIYSPTGWLKVTGQQRDEEPPQWDWVLKLQDTTGRAHASAGIAPVVSKEE